MCQAAALQLGQAEAAGLRGRDHVVELVEQLLEAHDLLAHGLEPPLLLLVKVAHIRRADDAVAW